MLLAESVRLGAVLGRLSGTRPVFHSEADFQQAFAWQVRTQDPTVRVRLETRPAPGIVRVEKFVAAMPGSNGAVVCVGNNPSYWNAPTHGRPTNADAFGLHESTGLHGPRAWGPLTGAGTSRAREEPLALVGPTRWPGWTLPSARTSQLFFARGASSPP